MQIINGITAAEKDVSKLKLWAREVLNMTTQQIINEAVLIAKKESKLSKKARDYVLYTYLQMRKNGLEVEAKK